MRKATVFKTTLLLFLLAQAMPAAFAQQDESATRAAPYRIGIFPGAGEFPSSGSLLHEQSEEQVARSVQASIENNRASVLAYSYYDDVLNEPRIKKPGKLWVRKKPNLDLVVRLARERRLDGVVMYSGILAFSTWYTKQPNPIWVYVIDIERGQVYREKGKNKDSSLTKPHVLLL